MSDPKAVTAEGVALVQILPEVNYMRVIEWDSTRLVTHNGCTSSYQHKFSAFILVSGISAIAILKLFWELDIICLLLGIVIQIFSILLFSWFFSPVKTSFDKETGTILIERVTLLNTIITQYPLSNITDVRIVPEDKKGGVLIYLVLTSGQSISLSNYQTERKESQKVLGIIKEFLALRSRV